MEKLATRPYSGMPVDVLFSLEFDAYMTFPMLTSQVAGNIISSDIAEIRGKVDNLSSDFWQGNKNTTKQYISLLKNIPKAFR
jgi:hypothetical protein